MLKLNKHTAITLLLFVGSFSAVAQQNDHILWYNKPAEKWTDALPIGNGRLGAMVFGGVEVEHLQFNEETLWTGKPRNYNRAGASAYLPTIRKLLAEGKQKEAEDLAQAQFMGLQSEPGDRKKWVAEMTSGKRNEALADFDDSNWKTIKVPAYEGWESVGLTNLDGAFWFRTTFNVPENWEGKNLVLDLNRIRDQDFTYVNGQLIGNTDNNEPRKYSIPAKFIKKGKNTIAIQVLNYFDKGGIAGYKDVSKQIGVYPEGLSMAQGVSLVKPWKYKIQNTNPPAVAQYQASYQPFGDLKLQFKSKIGKVINYKRTLDLNTAITNVNYTLNGVNYSRAYFVSAPHQAIVMHFTASKIGAISFDAVLSSPHLNASHKQINNHTLALKVQVKDGALKGESWLTAIVKKGSIKIVGHKISISKADEVTLYLTAGTNFINDHTVSGNPETANVDAVASLKNKTYNQVKTAHLKEYEQYFNKFSINFGTSENEKLPTDERIAKFATSNDAGLAALYVQYGRYLLISSSRPGTQPANLQGIWNDLLTPPWGSKYTTNINLQMNYWPADVLNLSQLNEPLFAKIKALSVNGNQTAKDYYSAKGWVLHHNTDIWNGTAPINASNHGIWVTGAAWLSQHLWEHYQFSNDKSFLAKDAYPLMKQAALFFNDFLVLDPKTGWLISTHQIRQKMVVWLLGQQWIIK